MKYIIIIFSFFTTFFSVSAQNYLQEANDCFAKGDYECAKKRYEAYKVTAGKEDVTFRIKQSEDCLKIIILADGYFEDKEYEKAGRQYAKVLEINPQDAYAKRQYNLCNSTASTTSSGIDNAVLQEIASNMVYVSSGSFTMGCTSEQGNDCYSDENPSHSVTVSGFYMSKYEVTQKQWQAVMGTNPSKFKGDNLPVESISWNEVQKFISKLNELTGKKYRLPTEAEWEFASRGGTKSLGYKYSGGNDIDAVAWYSENSNSQPHPVGQKHSNELGLYDMSGNVWEWCSDWYAGYSSFSQTNPQGPFTGSGRVFRGGSWFSYASYCRVSLRYDYDPGGSYFNLGFRLCL